MPRKSKYPVMTQEISNFLHRPLFVQEVLTNGFDVDGEIRFNDKVRLVLWPTEQEEKDYCNEQKATLVMDGRNERNEIMWLLSRKG